jgi:hypothetical protein
MVGPLICDVTPRNNAIFVFDAAAPGSRRRRYMASDNKQIDKDCATGSKKGLYTAPITVQEMVRPLIWKARTEEFAVHDTGRGGIRANTVWAIAEEHYVGNQQFS